ncbi:MAG TPA: heavy-metal-associated domain-containing protein [Nitrososphaeraceae archaeon]|jgi:Cu+-exporting ATPase|nr:heavy-metal-associated domain-containing protein [Nitrososphaeraceae archaeon]
MNAEKALFRIVGMYCVSCKPVVEKQLKGENGIKKIDIDYVTDSVIVEFDPVLITKEQIKKKLEKSGYKFVRTSHL